MPYTEAVDSFKEGKILLFEGMVNAAVDGSSPIVTCWGENTELVKGQKWRG